MKLVKLDRTVIEVFLIGTKTFRFWKATDNTGHTVITADEWLGWNWVRRHTWSGYGND